MKKETVEIKIAPATVDDIDEIEGIENRSFAAPWSRQSIMEELDGDYSHVYVARNASGSICGYICFTLVLDEMHLLNVAVDLPHRGQKIGTRLILHSIDMAAENGAKVAFLEVRKSDVAQRELYKKIGFQEISVRKKYYSSNDEDAIIMARYL